MITVRNATMSDVERILEIYLGSGLRLEKAAAGRNRRDYPHERG